MLRSLTPFIALFAFVGCPHVISGPDAGADAGTDAGGDAGTDGGPDGGPDAGPDAGPDGGPFDAGPYTDAGVGPFCTLPGSVIYTDAGITIVPSDGGGPDYAWLTLPVGFCVHHYATVDNVRQIRFAPGGELFASSPTNPTVSGGQNGLGAIVVLPDVNQDGVADSVLTFKSGLTSTVGMLFANGQFYHQENTAVLSQPYVTHQLVDNGEDSVAVDITVYSSTTHWPKTLDVSDTGTIFVGNGGDEGETCQQPMPFHGGILQIDGSAGGAQVAMGLRNPIAVKCHRDGNDHCFTLELARDYSADLGGREKLLLISPGDNWGFPCCASAGLPYSDVTVACPGDASQQCPPDCSTITADTNSFLIGNTPFGFDFVDEQFPAPWNHKVIVGLHGSYGTWAGARLVALDMDSSTGLLLGSSTMDGGDNGNMQDFAIGWDDGTLAHGRPTDVEMSPDGRLFIASDRDGEIFWIAPNVP